MADDRCGEQVELAEHLPRPGTGWGVLSCGRQVGHEGSHCATVEVISTEAATAYLWWDDPPTDDEPGEAHGDGCDCHACWPDLFDAGVLVWPEGRGEGE
jgi:hypothetical protein